MSRTLVGTSISLIDSKLRDRGRIPLLFTENRIYSVSVCLKKDSSVLIVNPNSVNILKTLSNVFIWYVVYRVALIQSKGIS